MNFDPNRGFNPYAPPSPDADLLLGAGRIDAGDQVLAERGTRLGASLLDLLLYFPASIPPAIYVAVADTRGLGLAEESWSPELTIVIVLFGVPCLAVAIYQWYLIATRGQSLAKKWLHIKIVKLDGSPVDFVSGVLLRSWVLAFVGYIPYIGSCISLVDALMIFGEERRCLHDHIAGTKVIVVPPGYS